MQDFDESEADWEIPDEDGCSSPDVKLGKSLFQRVEAATIEVAVVKNPLKEEEYKNSFSDYIREFKPLQVDELKKHVSVIIEDVD